MQPCKNQYNVSCVLSKVSVNKMVVRMVCKNQVACVHNDLNVNIIETYGFMTLFNGYESKGFYSPTLIIVILCRIPLNKIG